MEIETRNKVFKLMDEMKYGRVLIGFPIEDLRFMEEHPRANELKFLHCPRCRVKYLPNLLNLEFINCYGNLLEKLPF